MKQIIEEYGVAITEAIVTVALLGLFASMVFMPQSMLSEKLMTYVSGYAGYASGGDMDATAKMMKKSRKNVPEPRAIKSVFAGEKYGVDEVFDIPDGYTLRVTRAELLDDKSRVETQKGRGNMVIEAYGNDGTDMTSEICTDDGSTVTFPKKGYYVLYAKTADGKGSSTSGSYLVSVRE